MQASTQSPSPSHSKEDRWKFSRSNQRRSHRQDAASMTSACVATWQSRHVHLHNALYSIFATAPMASHFNHRCPILVEPVLTQPL